MIGLLYLGGLISLIGGIWLLVVAFKQSVWWGLGSLFIGPVALVFVILHWQDSKKPFLISLAGTLLCLFAAWKLSTVASMGGMST